MQPERRSSIGSPAVFRAPVVLLAAILAVGACQGRSGDRAGSPAVRSAELAPTLRLTPQSGPPGGEVTVIASGFPPRRRVGIGAGPPASEYEVFAHATTDREGRLQTTVRVPPHVSAGDLLIFAVTVPRSELDAVSDPFEVTPPGEGGMPAASPDPY